MATAKGKKAAGKETPAAKKASGEKKATPDKAAKVTKPAEGAKPEPKVSPEELTALRTKVEEAKSKLEKADVEAKALSEKARALVAEAKDAFRVALGPYRDACRKAGVECGYEGGRSANVSVKVSFLVERTDKGVRVMVKGRPKTEEVIPFATIEESINKTAYAYTEKHLGPKEEIGNKGGSLSNRLRAVIA